MNCYDCQTLDQPTPAVATCRACGAGICAQHTHARSQMLHRLNGTGVATKNHAVRQLLCERCAASNAPTGTPHPAHG
ncbi:DUF2180 family protein [Streptomyces inhibens]|uniref:DUF2180 family protein n=1 Tax=Streptomyces inhibens TaxID=2293571 RepID=UPI001EE699FC|nr:DUF2180 family protein [Streptomyces inhibens]UKY54185.1 DUF2180 family protein [Streptomyces inhibens]